MSKTAQHKPHRQRPSSPRQATVPVTTAAPDLEATAGPADTRVGAKALMRSAAVMAAAFLLVPLAWSLALIGVPLWAGGLVFGAVVGSFLNVVIWRVPRGESVVSPPSACPGCGSRIEPWDNIPVLSWLVLRAKCRTCKSPISARYPVIETLTALSWAGAGWAVGADWALAPAAWFFLAVAIALAAIDLDTGRLPDVLTIPAPLILLALLAAYDPYQVPRAALGALVFGVAFFVVWFAYPKGMGFGDVKLAPLVGAAVVFVGWVAVPLTVLVAFGGGAAASVALRRRKVPFGPFLLAGAVAGVMAGPQVWDWWMALWGL